MAQAEAAAVESFPTYSWLLLIPLFTLLILLFFFLLFFFFSRTSQPASDRARERKGGRRTEKQKKKEKRWSQDPRKVGRKWLVHQVWPCLSFFSRWSFALRYHFTWYDRSEDYIFLTAFLHRRSRTVPHPVNLCENGKNCEKKFLIRISKGTAI